MAFAHALACWVALCLLALARVAQGQAGEVIPASLDFPDRVVGSSAVLMLALYSTDEFTPLEPGSISITDDAGGAYQITHLDPIPLELHFDDPPVMVEVTFSPGAASEFPGELEIETNDIHNHPPDGLILVPLTGRGLAAGGTLYQYTGNPFTSAIGDYTTGDRITGTLTFATPLAPGLVSTDVTASVVAYSFSDGVQAYTEATPGVGETVFVSTDSNGDIVQSWNVSLTIDSTHSMRTRGEPVSSNDFGENSSISFGGNTDSPGTWQTIAAPEIPAMGPLAVAVLAALLVLAALAARTKRPGDPRHS